jgi:Zn-dependent protease with chaperone function
MQTLAREAQLKSTKAQCQNSQSNAIFEFKKYVNFTYWSLCDNGSHAHVNNQVLRDQAEPEQDNTQLSNVNAPQKEDCKSKMKNESSSHIPLRSKIFFAACFLINTCYRMCVLAHQLYVYHYKQKEIKGFWLARNLIITSFRDAIKTTENMMISTFLSIIKILLFLFFFLCFNKIVGNTHKKRYHIFGILFIWLNICYDLPFNMQMPSLISISCPYILIGLPIIFIILSYSLTKHVHHSLYITPFILLMIKSITVFMLDKDYLSKNVAPQISNVEEFSEINKLIVLLCDSVKFDANRVHVIMGPRNTGIASSYGTYKDSAVYLHTRFLRKNSAPVILSTLLHEIGHIKNGDPTLNILVKNSILIMTALLIVLMSSILSRRYGTFSGPILSALIYACTLKPIFRIVLNVFGHFKEFNADAFAVLNGYGKESLQYYEALSSNLQCDCSCTFLYSLYSTHPSSKSRVLAIENLIKNQI